MQLSVSSIFIVCCLCLNIVECSHTSSSFLESFIESLLTFSTSVHVPQSPIFKIISEDCSPDTSSEALNHMLLVATPSVISHLWGRPLSPDGFTSCHLPSSHQTLLPIVIPTSPCFWCHVLHGVDGWSDSSGAMWDAIGQRQRNSYYLHLSVIYFSSVRLKMAARDGDKPVWPAKHCPLQIPLFIHKLDPLGLRGRLVRSVDPCDVCVWVVAAKDRVCACMETFVNLG